MKIALVNLMTKTVDIPENIFKAIKSQVPKIESDEGTNIIELGKELTKMGNEVTIYASNIFCPSRCADYGDGLSVKYLPTKLTKFLPYLYFQFTPTLPAELVSNKYDVIQSAEFFQLGTILTCLAASQKKLPVFIWHELGIQQRFPGNLLQDIYSKTLGNYVQRNTYGFVPRSFSAKDWLLNKAIPRSKIFPVVHTGVNTRDFFPLKETSSLKEKFGVSEDNILIVSVSRLSSFKGLNNLIRAVGLVVKKFPKVSLIIRGDGPELFCLRDLIANLRLEKNIRIINKRLSRQELNELYNASDFTALPSTKELFPNFSIIESLACGKPVIHSSPGGQRDLWGDGFASLYVQYGDIEQLYEKIILLIRNIKYRQKMSENSLQLVREEYDLKNVATKLLTYYKTVVENK